uniref:Uncharacterized protein n=1 Tax=Arundo donax TaxID=35708 RepID=A0A0A8YX27_ARUDO
MAREACHSLSQINQRHSSQGSSSIATQKHLHLSVLISSRITRAFHSRKPASNSPKDSIHPAIPKSYSTQRETDDETTTGKLFNTMDAGARSLSGAPLDQQPPAAFHPSSTALSLADPIYPNAISSAPKEA